MAKKTKKKFFIALLALALVTSILAFYLYTKGPVDVRNSAGLRIEAVNLYNRFSDDSITAGKLYINKILRVEGIVNSISENASQQQVVLLKTGIDEAAVNCTMEIPVADIQPSGRMVIKGLCSGMGQGDADLGIAGDVYLTRCYAAKN